MRLTPLPWQDKSWLSIADAVRHQKLSHALLLVGPPGVGKRHFAAVLSQALLCTQPDRNSLPCGTCQACILISAGTHPDLHRLEKEEGSKVVKVDDVREFNRKVFLTPSSDRGNVGIIDPVDGLNRSSANALLKSLEEPPRGTHILLIGERWLSLPATLRSRCLTLRFAIPESSIVRQWLTKNATSSQYPLLDRLKLRYQPDLDQQGDWADSLLSLCMGKTDPIQLAERWSKPGTDLSTLLDWSYSCVSDLLKLKNSAHPETLSNSSLLKTLQPLAGKLSVSSLNLLAQRNLETKRLIETQARPQMLLENLLASWYQSSMSSHTTPVNNGAGKR